MLINKKVKTQKIDKYSIFMYVLYQEINYQSVYPELKAKEIK